MKVALVSSLYEPHGYGGAERVAQSVAEALAAKGHAVDVITLGRPGDPPAAERNGVRVHAVPLRNFYWPFPVSGAGFAAKVAWHLRDAWNPAMGRAVGALLEALRPEIVNTHNLAGFSASAWGAAVQCRVPIVHTLHDHYLLCSYSTMFRDGKNCARPCLRCNIASAARRAMTGRVDGVIGVSRYILERHLGLGLFAGAQTAVVHSAAPAASPTGAGAAPPPAGGPLRIGFLGGLVPAKGLHGLLDAFLALPAGTAELRIGGAGDADYEAELRRRAAARDDVRWLGVVQSDAFLAEIDLLAVPSLVHEAMGRVVVEAFGHGVPVIAARRGGLPELVRGDSGWLYEPDDAGALPALLRKLADDPAQLAPRRAAALAAAPAGGMEAMLEGYLATYAAVLERRAVAAALAAR